MVEPLHVFVQKLHQKIISNFFLKRISQEMSNTIFKAARAFLRGDASSSRRAGRIKRNTGTIGRYASDF